MAAGGAEASSSLLTLHCPGNNMILVFTGWPRQQDWFQPGIIVSETKPVIELLLQLERFYSTQNRMRRSELHWSCPGLDCGIPLLRPASVFIIEVAADPFGDPVVKAAGIERRPVILHEAAATLHFLLDDL